jgi:hypothetical protein
VDAQDIRDITNVLVDEIFDQECFIGPYGPYGCMVTAETGTAAQGSVSTDLGAFWRIMIHPDAEPYIKRGARITSARGMDAIINGHDAGRSVHAFNEILATREVSSMPFPDNGDPTATLTIKRWDAPTLTWTEMVVPNVQVGRGPDKQVFDHKTRLVREVGTVQVTGPLNTDILVGDRFDVDDGIARVYDVRHLDQFEADAEVTGLG